MNIESTFLNSFPSRLRNVLIKHEIFSQIDLINFAKKNDLKLLQTNSPNKISLKSLGQLKKFIPKEIATVSGFYSCFPVRIQNILKKNNIHTKQELSDFVTLLPNKIKGVSMGKKTVKYIEEFLANPDHTTHET
jgi:hypothetical protein